MNEGMHMTIRLLLSLRNNFAFFFSVFCALLLLFVVAVMMVIVRIERQ
jgi:hypothetical protein